jgi:hypothetical protein
LKVSAEIGHGTRFSLVAGGPFYTVLRRLGLVEADGLTGHRAAISLALLAWLPPAVLAVAQSLIEGGHQGWGYFTDMTVPARYLIAIWAMVVTERYADSRFVILVQQFREAQLLTREELPAFEKALTVADHHSSSRLAEFIILAIALISSGFAIQYSVMLTSGWEGSVAGDQVELSWAGAAVRYLSNPLFLFLALRWGWWFLVWAALLYRISRMPLQLIPTHPDRSAGLGFLAIYPGVFSGFAFALGCVISSSMLKELDYAAHAPERVWIAISVWLVINLVVLAAPLLVFAAPMYAAREQALLEFGRLATKRHLAMRRRWIGHAETGEENAGTQALPSVGELNTSVNAVREMGYSPINRTAVIQIIVAAGIPMLAVIITLVPLGEMLQWALRKIL